MTLGIDHTLRRVGDALDRATREVGASVRTRQEGRVEAVGDGILRISGLPDARAEEVLRVGENARALALSLAPHGIDAIVLDAPGGIGVGERVRATGDAASIGVGPCLLGRVVDPLGHPLDGAPLVGSVEAMLLEREAPAIFERANVHLPLYTGILAVDAMFAIGRGQRELILGDDGTGKTSLALDVMIRQAKTEVVGVWVAIGRRRAEVWQIVEALRRAGGRWVVVAAFEDQSPGMRYLAPYAGAAVSEYFARRGEHALVVYDELSAHAVAWRELSLLLRRPPGREAYPGDVFYLHARLLERAAQLSKELGAGSVTALPIASLEGGRLTAYIPTNLISITDGQLVLSASLFASGQRPAIDAGLSVSRVGAKAQPQAFKELAGRMRLDYSSFLELEAFSRLGTRLEASTLKRLEFGRRVRALLRAPRLEPLGVFDEVVRLVLASAPELLARIPEARTQDIAGELTRHLCRDEPTLARRVEDAATLSGEERETLLRAAAAFLDARFPSDDG